MEPVIFNNTALRDGHTSKLQQACLLRIEGDYQQLSEFTSPANECVDSGILSFQVPGVPMVVTINRPGHEVPVERVTN